jgi:hypothetical protein
VDVYFHRLFHFYVSVEYFLVCSVSKEASRGLFAQYYFWFDRFSSGPLLTVLRPQKAQVEACRLCLGLFALPGEKGDGFSD